MPYNETNTSNDTASSSSSSPVSSSLISSSLMNNLKSSSSSPLPSTAKDPTANNNPTLPNTLPISTALTAPTGSSAMFSTSSRNNRTTKNSSTGVEELPSAGVTFTVLLLLGTVSTPLAVVVAVCIFKRWCAQSMRATGYGRVNTEDRRANRVAHDDIDLDEESGETDELIASRPGNSSGSRR